MKREMERGKINGLRRGLTQGGVVLIVALILLPAAPSPALADRDGSTRTLNRGATLAAGFSHSCALLADGRVQCWGHKLHFDAPREGTKAPSFFPVAESTVPETISGITNAVAVAAQDLHPCAVLADGRVQCWGLTPSVLGNRTTIKSSAPVTVSLTKAVTVGGGAAKQ